jgi:hypothetical protein
VTREARKGSALFWMPRLTARMLSAEAPVLVVQKGGNFVVEVVIGVYWVTEARVAEDENLFRKENLVKICTQTGV